MVSGRRCPSSETTVSFFRVFTVTGTISSACEPARNARSAVCWLRSAYSSEFSRVTPVRSATFSAVSDIESPQRPSVRAATRLSSSFPWPSRSPTRAPRTTKGAWLMDSMPPASTMSASPASCRCAAEMTAWMPEPQSRFTVSAGTESGTPARSPTWRAP